jgi:hypothetical protein
MGGPRVTSGPESNQAYETPDVFMSAVIKRFGPISFDLAARAENKKHDRYFAPRFLYEFGTAEALKIDVEALPENVTFKRVLKSGERIYERKVENQDSRAYGIDAFEHDWSDLSRRFGDENPSGHGLLWLNCEWTDSDDWARKCDEEMSKGSNILLLTHVAISKWFVKHVAGKADCYLLHGRMSFDGKNVYPKDCMLSHYHPDARGDMRIWDWKSDLVTCNWKM